MTSISLHDSRVLPGARPVPGREVFARLLPPRRRALLVLAAAAAMVAGLTGFAIDLRGSAGAIRLSTPAVQLASVTIALLVDLAIGLMHDRRSARRRMVALEERLADARAQAYRLQLQPHFLFNALQAAATLVHHDAAKADLMLVALADFLRFTMQTAEAREVPLVTELALLDRYVEVMRYRHGDRLQVTVTADPGTLDARVPQLLLQPLVENALRHGVREGGCRVHVRIVRDGDTLRCLVRDEGHGLRPGTRGNGVGLRSTRGRLEALYGASGQLRLANAPGGGVAATVTLPFHTAPGACAA